MVQGIVLIILGLFPFWGAEASSIELRRLQKCHALLVGERILKTDPLYQSVLSGSLSGTDACMSLLDQARLGDDGKIPIQEGVPNAKGTKILSTFLEFHRSNLASPDYFIASASSKVAELDVFDTNEPAFNWLYSLFKPNESFSSTLTRSHAIRAIRYTTRTTPRTKPLVSGSFRFSQGPGPTPAPWNPTLIETGILAGFIPDTVQNPIQILENTAYQGSDTNRHYGGGFLGSQSYLHAAYNNNGRVWAKNVLSDALCKEIPVLRSIDVLSSVIPESTFPWRQGISCMQCHDSIDELSGGIRSHFQIRASPAYEVRFWVTRTVDRPSAPYPTLSTDSLFYRRPPDFALKYRSYDGRLVKLNASGIVELGNMLANQDDFYVCAAKRYFEFLTGIEIDLRDDSDPLNPLNLNSDEKKYRNQVIELGKKLKHDQNARELLKRIIGSSTFVLPDQGV